MLSASCHCGNVEIKLNAQAGSLVNCNCSICRRLSALWGYHKSNEVMITVNNNQLVSYAWGDKYIDFHSCSKCGCTTHYTCREKAQMDRVGVNYNLFENDLIAKLEIKKVDGANW